MNVLRHTFTLCLAAIIWMSGTLSCKKLVVVDPPSMYISSGRVFESDANSNSLVIAIYHEMTYGFTGGSRGLSAVGGLLCDELDLFPGASNMDMVAYYRNELSASRSRFAWNTMYNFINRLNVAIAGMQASEKLTPAVKTVLIAESKFLRAFMYFYLTNLFGDIPMPLSADYRENALLSRSKSADIYAQIISDLQAAQASLGNGFTGGNPLETSSERVRASKWAATALLARVYLYNGQYEEAETEASKIIENATLFKLLPLQEVFLKNSMEAIWQIQPTGTNINTEDAPYFILPSGTIPQGDDKAVVSRHLLTAFETGDQRKQQWMGLYTSPELDTSFYYPYKYKVMSGIETVTEYPMVLRLGEQYLIRAEARAYQGKLTGDNSAAADLNALRARAGLGAITASSKEAVLDAIMHERHAELFTEWAHRWFDLKRTGTIDAVMKNVSPQKRNSVWSPNDKLLPIPLDDIKLNPKISQNPGY